VPFGYYRNLSTTQKAVYRKSDAIASIRLPVPSTHYTQVAALRAALAADDRRAVTDAATRLCAGLTAALAVPSVEVEVLDVRPRRAESELHGLYTYESGARPTIHVWMRTAHHRRVVAFRTFLRTLLHEVCHHLDFQLLALPDSFHTQGFFKRESSLFHQLVPRAPEPIKDFAG